ncbi:adenosylcobinamide-GDP ribazoletransferase [Nonomuraea rosea]|uniref:Adenosylcobinamide-GDP ribazoletransferase n=1 Tax=Nonomuraea rosea TaxID=638574 RepID=A0ABP6WR23_9ACTN
MRLVHGLRFAIGTLSVFPVRVERVDREVAGQAMVLAPAVGLVLGAVAGLPLLLPASPLLGAALAVGLLAVLTRGLHLDGLADLADGLGSGKPADQALDIMKKSDIGPFGVMALVFTLLVQVAALAEAGATSGATAGTTAAATAGAMTGATNGAGFAALVTACAAGRLALTWACRAGVPAARPGGLGAMVAGTVRPSVAWAATVAATVAALLASAAIGFVGSLDSQDSQGSQGLAGVVVPPIALLIGLGAALLLLRHARRRLGGVTGDVLGALVETATATTLVVCAVLG